MKRKTKQQKIDDLQKYNNELLKDIYTLIDEQNTFNGIATKHKYIHMRKLEQQVWFGSCDINDVIFSFIKNKQ